MEIDWTNPKQKLSKYFTVHECLFLPSWGIYHVPSEEEKTNLLQLLVKMDQVREFLGKPINVHCVIRPGKVNNPNFDPKTVRVKDTHQQSALDALDYNMYVCGAQHSSHKDGLAMDFDCGEDCDNTRTKLLVKLEEFELCMENLKGPWIHLDISPPSKHGGHRYFIP